MYLIYTLVLLENKDLRNKRKIFFHPVDNFFSQ